MAHSTETAGCKGAASACGWRVWKTVRLRRPQAVFATRSRMRATVLVGHVKSRADLPVGRVGFAHRLHAGNSGLLSCVRDNDLAILHDVEAVGPFPAAEDAVVGKMTLHLTDALPDSITANQRVSGQARREAQVSGCRLLLRAGESGPGFRLPGSSSCGH